VAHRSFLLFAVAFLSLLPLARTARADEPKKIRIVLVGDSTVEDKSGWGPGFKKMLTADADCFNWARGGRSSKSFINEGWWKKALADKPDWVLIQFGHNDQPGKGPERETDPKTTYPQWMSRYVDEARAAGAKPVLFTSLTRRHFDKDGKIVSDLTDYVEAVKKLAAEKGVPLVDLNAASIAQLNAMGKEAAEVFDPKPTTKSATQPATPDKTHLSPKGQEIVGKLVAEELKKVVPELAPYIKGS
jgi:pectinesterase